MTPWWFLLTGPMRRRALRKQKIVRVEVQGLEHLKRSLSNNRGVMLTPNHSFHWDSYCLVAAAEELRTPFYIMTAWQTAGETLDKLEEDALEATYPTVHAEREVVVRFDQPIDLPIGNEKRLAPAELTDQLEQRVQSMLAT